MRHTEKDRETDGGETDGRETHRTVSEGVTPAGLLDPSLVQPQRQIDNTFILLDMFCIITVSWLLVYLYEHDVVVVLSAVVGVWYQQLG